MQDILTNVVTLIAVLLGWFLGHFTTILQERKTKAGKRKAVLSELIHARVICEQNAKCIVLDTWARIKGHAVELEFGILDLYQLRQHFRDGIEDPEVRLCVSVMLASEEMLNRAAAQYNNCPATVANRMPDADYEQRYVFYCEATKTYALGRALSTSVFHEKNLPLVIPKRTEVRVKEWQAGAVWFDKFVDNSKRLPTVDEVPRFWAGEEMETVKQAVAAP